MTNHVHLLATPRGADSLPRVMRSLGRRYVRYDSERYFLSCCRYIELNPVRARMVRHPREYRLSSYRAHARGAADTLATGRDIYDRLGRTQAERQIGYRAVFRDALDPGFIDELRAANNGGWALGDARFKREIASAPGRRVAPLPRGRPPKPKRTAREPSLL
jgi:putative transposase